ncbi:MAG: RNA-binding S4 domain-containing protein [Clostridiales bacterium]|nr:RNA-binding S4 domain-containing protein [Clostridiales bacterium]
MRLDKFLKVSRLIKRRTVANEVCDAGQVSVNEKIARASHKVKLGDIVEIHEGPFSVKVKIIGLHEHATKENASNMYQKI